MRPPVRVLQSFPEPRPTTNPYIVQLRRSLDALDDVELVTFSWRRALSDRYDVFHMHWPETLIAGRGPKALARQLLFLLLMVRLSARQTAVVRTAHNLHPQEQVSAWARFLLRRAERRTTLYVRINEQTPLPPGAASVTVVHGHYRHWFAGHPRPARQPGQVAFVGLIRPYKNVAGLVAAFRTTAGAAPDARLDVAGSPRTEDLAAAVRAAADGDPRVALRLRHLDDAELVEVIGRAELVVLPYREMHNSGAALLALSLDRPVLVPDNEVTARLAAEVGQEWVMRYSGELDGQRILDALARAGQLAPDGRPDLGRRDWDSAGTDHLTAYRRAIELRRAGGRFRPRRR
jgi:glycosyltransferase involved in cell wall biosynthesis